MAKYHAGIVIPVLQIRIKPGQGLDRSANFVNHYLVAQGEKVNWKFIFQFKLNFQ